MALEKATGSRSAPVRVVRNEPKIQQTKMRDGVGCAYTQRFGAEYQLSTWLFATCGSHWGAGFLPFAPSGCRDPNAQAALAKLLQCVFSAMDRHFSSA